MRPDLKLQILKQLKSKTGLGLFHINSRTVSVREFFFVRKQLILYTNQLCGILSFV